MGTLVSVSGAMVMTLYKGSLILRRLSISKLNRESETGTSSRDFVKGSLFLIFACSSWSDFMTFQAVICSGLSWCLQGSVMKQRGPVFVTSFSPLSMIVVTIVGLFFLAEALLLGSAWACSAVGRIAQEVVNEVRRQFIERPGIMDYKEKPDYGRCVAIVASASLREMIKPGA